MKREFADTFIEQRSDDKFINATSILRYYNDHHKKQKVLAEFFSNKGTGDFMEALLKEVNSNIGDSLQLTSDLYKTKRGASGGTYMHPYLFVKFAMWLSPEFEVKCMKWIYDNLIELRHEVGDHYKPMCKAIESRFMEWSNGKQPDPLVYIREANFLKLLAFGYIEKPRNEATEQELRLLNALQLANIKLILSGVGKDERHKRLRDFAVIYS